MSGSNPFRHKKPHNDQTAAQLAQPLQASLPAYNNRSNHSTRIDPASGAHGEDPSRQSQRHKVVRIASPPVPTQPSLPPSADDHPPPASNRASFLNHSAHRGSPPPPFTTGESSISDEESAGDPFNPDASGSDNEEYGDNGDGRHVVEGKSGVIGLGLEIDQRGSEGPSGAEQAVVPDGPDLAALRRIDESMTPPPSASKGKRATMDVDAFTRMLMTGETGGVGKEPATGVQRRPSQPSQAPPISDSSSNTDTGSTSKQPIFETRHLPRVETPRTSHELSTSEADEERRKLAVLSNPAEKQKPPPPKTRHGKLIQPNAGQTSPLVGLASITSPNHRSASPVSISFGSLAEQESGDVNKPLPQPPVDYSLLSVSPEQTYDDAENPSPLPQQKRPPTPPLTRRHSQMKPSQSRLSRNNSARHSMPPTTTVNNLNTTSYTNLSSSPLKIPPTPPSRRKDRESSTLSSSDTSTLLPQERRQTSRQRSNSREDSSDKSSLRSVETVSTISNKRISQGPPRPPPPRRGGGGGSRASLDESRPVLLGSTDSPTATMGIGIDNAEDVKKRAPGTPLQSHATDILADLSRLQKEVDDLRGRYEERKQS
ncbi:hypothetical protein ACJ72_06940 [Emergomyces africanus]|uniref:Uncharacterized protein n=1 Tax=Emergomyces africanus TaxID=1955775 RepID=A0A1B7NPN3_9EURO|nr:hypothetical protein ACJ72_06940 [Emergomyces africanus]